MPTRTKQDYFVNVINQEPIPVTLGSDTITITGDVNVGTTVTVDSTPESPVHTHITEVGTSGLLSTAYLPVGGTVELGSTTLSALEHVSIDNFPATQAVTGTFWQATQPVSGNVNATITDVITVVAEEAAGELYAFNNHAINTNRGWTMDDTMRPVISIRVNSSGTTTADLMEIVEYEVGNNNANQSTIVYEWYEGDLSISGAAIPSWTTTGTKIQYRIYQDKYSSNAGNTFTSNGAKLRHSGIIIGKNTSGDEGPGILHGGATPNILTLCMRRVDNSTKLDVWFAFTCKELT
jgi:hypothetical protein